MLSSKPIMIASAFFGFLVTMKFSSWSSSSYSSGGVCCWVRSTVILVSIGSFWRGLLSPHMDNLASFLSALAASYSLSFFHRSSRSSSSGSAAARAYGSPDIICFLESSSSYSSSYCSYGCAWLDYNQLIPLLFSAESSSRGWCSAMLLF